MPDVPPDPSISDPIPFSIKPAPGVPASATSNLLDPLANSPAANRSETERQRRLTHLAEMGTLAAGLAHELKNPLSTLKLNLQLLQEDLAALPGAEASRNRAATLWRVADRLTQTLEDFLRYAGRLELHLQPVALNTLVQDLADFLHPQAQASGVRMHTALSPANPVCLLDPHLAKQALFNLLINAVQAMAGSSARDGAPAEGGSGGGELIIRTQTGPTHAIVDIADTGVGIPKENLDRIFQAYFTTKKGGTGLGLPTARRIVEEHRGNITVTSEPGQGTNFRVEFPLAAPEKHP
jgi:signal transduction histidine kinase